MITIDNISKIYTYRKGFFSRKQTNVALQNVNLTIPEGQILGILGMNGSGKSTLIKCMTGIIQPTYGSISVDHLDPFKNRKKLTDKMGVIFSHKSSFIEDLLVKDNLEVFRTLYGLTNEQFQSMFQFIDAHIGISELMDQQFRKLSFGQRMKCELTSILLHKPKYLYLDEPTIGLDIFTKDELYRLLKYYNTKFQSTITITTHEVDVLDAFCDRIVIFDKGKIIADDTPELLKKGIQNYYRIQIDFQSVKDERAKEKLIKMYSGIEIGKHTIEISVSRADESIYQHILSAFIIRNMETKPISLKEAIQHVYSKKEHRSV